MTRDDGYGPNFTLDQLRAGETPCNTCRHKFRDGRRGCEAFPGGDIPADILKGLNQHREPVPGDRGITYAPVVEG